MLEKTKKTQMSNQAYERWVQVQSLLMIHCMKWVVDVFWQLNGDGEDDVVLVPYSSYCLNFVTITIKFYRIIFSIIPFLPCFLHFCNLQVKVRQSDDGL